MRKSGSVGSSFDEFLEAEGLREEAHETAVKRVLAYELSEAMRKSGTSKAELARRMRTSRSQVDRLLDAAGTGVKLETLSRAARAVGRELRIELV